MFAVSGAALMARRTALEDVREGDEYLDESFFMYKEDVDLGWRMRLRGWECWYVPGAVARHGRTSRGLAGRPYLAAPRAHLANQLRKPRHVRVHSLKNQWVLLLKDASVGELLRDAPWIAAREGLAAAGTAAASPGAALQGIQAFMRAAPDAFARRRRVQRRAVVDPAELRARWFTA